MVNDSKQYIYEANVATRTIRLQEMAYSTSKHAAYFSVMLLVPQIPTRVALVASITLAIVSCIFQFLCTEMSTLGDSLENIETTIKAIDTVSTYPDLKSKDRIKRWVRFQFYYALIPSTFISHSLRSQHSFLTSRHNIWRSIISYKEDDLRSFWLLFQQVKDVKKQTRDLQHSFLVSVFVLSRVPEIELTVYRNSWKSITLMNFQKMWFSDYPTQLITFWYNRINLTNVQ